MVSQSDPEILLNGKDALISRYVDHIEDPVEPPPDTLPGQMKIGFNLLPVISFQNKVPAGSFL